jgi:hypothetical protein
LNLVTDTKEKVEKIYKYLQEKTRYVSVQLGIGGWQPYDASYVHKNGYGDCKALSNYMVSLLKLNGITAYPVLIKNGHHRFPLITEFPSNQFNHVIVCVPVNEDTIWLECTSQLKSAGYIGWSNENRNALLLTPEGGKIVRTPSSTSDKNSQIKRITVELFSIGEAKVNASINWCGNQQEAAIEIAENSTPKEKEKWIRNLLSVPEMTLNNYKFISDNKNQTGVELQTELALPFYCSVHGSRIFFNPNLMERRTTIPVSLSEKISPVRLKYPYLDIDSITYRLPANYKVETLPKEIDLQSSFGSFKTKTILNEDNTIYYNRSLEIKNYSIPPENYCEYIKFLTEVVNADKQQVVLIQK